MDWEPKCFQDSILPIMVLNWFTGLSVIEYPLGKTRPVLTFIYAFIIYFAYWFTYFNDTTVEIDKDRKDLGTHILLNINCVNMFIATCSCLTGWYYYKAFKTNIQRLQLLDETLERLNLVINYRETFINLLLKTVMWVVLICLLLFFDVCYLSILLRDLALSFFFLYLFHFPIHLNSVAVFSFTMIINCIGMRFENINVLLKKTLSTNPAPKAVIKLYPNYSRISTIVMLNEIKATLRDRHRQMELLILIRHLHLELSKISYEINKIYRKQITMDMGIHFIITTGFLYKLFIVIFLDDSSQKEKIYCLISTLLWCATLSYRFLNINSTCAKVSSESCKTRDILYELKNFIEDKELKEEFEQFSLQLTQRPLVFNTYGFSTLDYCFVHRFIGMGTTFLVIFIQCSPRVRV